MNGKGSVSTGWRAGRGSAVSAAEQSEAGLAPFHLKESLSNKEWIAGR